MPDQPRLRVRACELREANAFVAEHHRHHKPVQGHRFSMAAFDSGRLCGVVVVGRPVARLGGAPSEVLEVTRLCTDGTANACSALYAAAARAGRSLGYRLIQTFILDTEPGTSLRAAGWRFHHLTEGDTWTGRVGREGRRSDQPTRPKQCWIRDLSSNAAARPPLDGGRQ